MRRALRPSRRPRTTIIKVPTRGAVTDAASPPASVCVNRIDACNRFFPRVRPRRGSCTRAATPFVLRPVPARVQSERIRLGSTRNSWAVRTRGTGLTARRARAVYVPADGFSETRSTGKTRRVIAPGSVLVRVAHTGDRGPRESKGRGHKTVSGWGAKSPDVFIFHVLFLPIFNVFFFFFCSLRFSQRTFLIVHNPLLPISSYCLGVFVKSE